MMNIVSIKEYKKFKKRKTLSFFGNCPIGFGDCYECEYYDPGDGQCLHPKEF